MPCLECMQNRAVDHFEPMTHADAIRNMTDEELAEFFTSSCVDRVGEEICYTVQDCRCCFLKWLQAEVGDVNE